MDRNERFYKIERMLRNRDVVPIRDFLEELGVSEATFKRDIEYLRERLNAPIPWDREKRERGRSGRRSRIAWWRAISLATTPRRKSPGISG